jgi:hypothetical protein
MKTLCVRARIIGYVSQPYIMAGCVIKYITWNCTAAWCVLLFDYYKIRSRDCAVGIATGYGLDDRGVGVWVPVGARIVSSPCCPDQFWVPPSLLSNGNRGGSFLGVKWPGMKWPFTSNYCRGQENTGLYILSPIRLHGVVLIKSLVTAGTEPGTFYRISFYKNTQEMLN